MMVSCMVKEGLGKDLHIIAFLHAHFLFWWHEHLSDRSISKRYPKSDAAPWVQTSSISKVFHAHDTWFYWSSEKHSAWAFHHRAVALSLNGSAAAHQSVLKKHLAFENESSLTTLSITMTDDIINNNNSSSSNNNTTIIRNVLVVISWDHGVST